MKKGFLLPLVAIVIIIIVGTINFLIASPLPDEKKIEGSVSSTTTIMPGAANIKPENPYIVPPIQVTMTPEDGKTDAALIYFYSYSSFNQIKFSTDAAGTIPLTNVTYQANNDGWLIYTVNSNNANLTFFVNVTNGDANSNATVSHILRGPTPDAAKSCHAYTATYIDNAGDIWATLTIGDSKLFSLN